MEERAEYNYVERVAANRLRRMAREQKVKQQKRLIVLILFLLVLIIGLLSMRAFAYADESISANRVKQYRSITIYAGDSLSSISTTYMTPEYSDPSAFVTEVAFINNMDPEAPLIPGNHLIVPYYTEAQDL
ncbi:MAG: hypothetical protein K6D90_08150 [Lachnospiraceae bacterium]|nr:hypothetical protein [Lachnospiraceae bacterium]